MKRDRPISSASHPRTLLHRPARHYSSLGKVQRDTQSLRLSLLISQYYALLFRAIRCNFKTFSVVSPFSQSNTGPVGVFKATLPSQRDFNIWILHRRRSLHLPSLYTPPPPHRNFRTQICRQETCRFRDVVIFDHLISRNLEAFPGKYDWRLKNTVTCYQATNLHIGLH